MMTKLLKCLRRFYGALWGRTAHCQLLRSVWVPVDAKPELFSSAANMATGNPPMTYHLYLAVTRSIFAADMST